MNYNRKLNRNLYAGQKRNGWNLLIVGFALALIAFALIGVIAVVGM